MDILWAPWRIKYIKSKKKKSCIFCESRKTGAKDFVILKTTHSTARLNIFPYSNGHILVSPLRHIKGLSQLSEDEALDLFRILNKVKKMLDKVLKPDGYNIGFNLSKAAGAGITDHLHIHVVPRWIGDNNFMPALNGTKIISQSLRELYRQLNYVKSKTD